VEQQHLKRLVLDYEQREEAEELKGMFYSLRSFTLIWLMGFKLYKLVIAREPSRYATLDEWLIYCLEKKRIIIHK
jgi:hypothetical protein